MLPFSLSPTVDPAAEQQAQASILKAISKYKRSKGCCGSCRFDRCGRHSPDHSFFEFA